VRLATVSPVAEPMVELLANVWSSIADVCRERDDAAWERTTDCPGWSVKDNVAHMIGTERMLMGEQPASGDAPDAPYVRNDIGRMNEQWVESYRSMRGPDVLSEFEAVTTRRLDVLRGMSPDAWDAEGFTPEGPGPYRQFMAIRVFDCWYHEQDIREALDAPGGLEGAVADHSLGRIARGLSYVVGKKAGAPQGSTVVFDVTGSPPIVVAIGVDGRAAVLDAAPSNPTVRLTMDRRTYARLAGGRGAGERVLDDQRVAIEGDPELGARIVRQMAFTI
jgi:uncharacterized protein (TIGR03083 family)